MFYYVYLILSFNGVRNTVKILIVVGCRGVYTNNAVSRMLTALKNSGGQKMPRVVHFELPAVNPERASKFYTDVFGWKIQKWEGGGEPYWLVTTGDEKMPGINGGIMKKKAPMTMTINTLDVPSVDEYTAKIVKNGGKIIAPKMPVMEVGWLAYCKDTEGNIFGIMQMDKGAK